MHCGDDGPRVVAHHQEKIGHAASLRADVEHAGLRGLLQTGQVCARAEISTRAADYYYAALLVARRRSHGLLQLVDQFGVERVAFLRTVERDARDAVLYFIEDLRLCHVT